MKAKVLKIVNTQSRSGGKAYLVCTKGDDLKSYSVWLDEKWGNFRNWREILRKGPGTIIEGFMCYKPGKIDGDSKVVIVGFEPEKSNGMD